MNKKMRALVFTGIVITLLTLFTFAAYAQQVFSGNLDSFDPVEDGSAGPIFTGPLESGAPYMVTVEGTYSIWSSTHWASVCAGTPGDEPIFPTPSKTNGKVGFDAAYIFSIPTSSPSLCPGGVPVQAVPFRHSFFSISTDGGTTWASLDPVETSISADHIYHYEVMGMGATVVLGFGITDTPLSDNYGQLKITVEKVNRPPMAEAGGPYFNDEGSVVTFDGSLSSDPDGDALTYTWDFGDGSTGVGVNPTHTYTDNGDYPVCLTVTDTNGASTTACTTAFIANVAPSVGPIAVDETLIPIGATINTTVDFTDPGTADTHTAVWDWGDGSTSPGVVTEVNGSGSVTGSHVYTAVGKYTITLTVTDDDGGSASSVFQYVEVFDPTEPTGPDTVILTNCFKITFLGYTDHGDGTSTWSYRVEELPCAKDLSNWVLELPSCAGIVDASPSPWEKVHPDPNIHLTGIKWEVRDSFVIGEFSVTLSGDLVQGTTQVGAKGPDVAVGTIIGPECASDDDGSDDNGDGDGDDDHGKGNNGNVDNPGKGNNGDVDNPGKGNNGDDHDDGDDDHGKGNNSDVGNPGNGKGNNSDVDNPGKGKGNNSDVDNPGKGNNGDDHDDGDDDHGKGNNGDVGNPGKGNNGNGSKEGKGD